MDKKRILAFVGMPGAGKSEVVTYLEKKGIPFVRFGQVTDDGLKEQNLPLTEENEKHYRENLRKEMGMAAYAKKVEPKIRELLENHNVVALEGLRSWEEYLYLSNIFPNFVLTTVYAEPQLRYTRLSERTIRPLTPQAARQRDIAELEGLNMGGPIAIADHLLINDADLDTLHTKIENLLKQLTIV